jgi:hypothetical protein
MGIAAGILSNIFSVCTFISASMGPTYFQDSPLSSEISKWNFQPPFSVLEGLIYLFFTYTGLFLIGPKKFSGKGMGWLHVFPPSFERIC